MLVSRLQCYVKNIFYSQGLQLLQRPTEKSVPCPQLANDVKTTNQQFEKTLPNDLVGQYLHNKVSGILQFSLGSYL